MADLRILSGGAANGLVNALAEAFRQDTGLGISGDFGAVGGMRDRVLAGEAVDLVILTQSIIDQLTSSGDVSEQTVTDIGNVVTGVAVLEGAPLPDVSTPEGLRRLLTDADGIYFPDPEKATAGIHFAGVLDALGVADQVAEKLHAYPNGQTAMAAMAKSGHGSPVGCTQITEILNTPGVSYAGDLPKEHGLVTTYTAAVSSRAANAEAASRLTALLTDPAHASLRTRCGFAS